MRRFLRVTGIIVALLVILVLSLPFLISADRFKPMLESKLSAALGRAVTIGNLKLSVLRGAVTADGLAIADDPAFGKAPFLKAKSLRIGVELWPLIASRKLNVTGLTVEQPEVLLLQSASGDWNYSSLGGKQAAAPAGSSTSEGGLDLSAKLVRIADGRFSMGKTVGRHKPLALENVNLEVREFSPSATFPFSFDAKVAGGGNIKLSGKAGPIDSTDVQLTPLSMTLDVERLNLASALAGTAPDIAGTASLQATGSSNAGRVVLNGKLKAEGLKLAKKGTPAKRPVAFDFGIQHDLRTHAGSLQHGNIKVGSASASLTGTYAQRAESTVLNMKFAGTKMAVPELAELLPPLGVALPNGSRLEGGTATAAFTVGGPADRLAGDGSVSLDKTRLANFDLGTKMTVIQTLAGIRTGPNTDIETLSAKLKYSPEGSVVDDLKFVAQGVGELAGAGTISPANALDFKMQATVQTTRSAALSRTAVPFFVQGTAMDPVFRPDIRGLAKSQAETVLKGTAGQRAGEILGGLFGRKKK